MIDLGATLQGKIDLGEVHQIVELLRIDKPDGAGTERRTSADHDVIATGNTWVSDGRWLGVNPIATNGANVDDIWQIYLDLTDPAILSANYEGSIARYYVAFLYNAGTVIGDPVLMAYGGDVSLGADEEEIDGVPTRTLNVHSILWADQFEATQNARTHRGQIDRYSGDGIFKDTALLRRTEFRLGGKGVSIWR